ncbi:IS3 family transposase [Thaumasiovibrio subtropicus]|uniref:IS3 family transposase n=3 Tax=Thaumasiovibrio subtropicus TaxID=1891207 RepID=UPI001C84E06F|nr:IS3 family transposase [Thaumasiovibrio subtropicus]
MSGKRYTEEFKIQAVEQVTKHGHTLNSTAERLGVSYKSLCDWVKRYEKPAEQRQQEDDQNAELRKLKAELKRVTMERDIFKGSRRVLCRGVKEKYTFISERLQRYPLKVMCQILEIQRSGFYAWQRKPLSCRAKEDQRLLGKIKQFWLESGCVYGYRNITIDLRSDGESCGKNRVYRLMKQANIKAVRGYKRHLGFGRGKPHVAAPNVLDRGFNVDKPDRAWVTDFTYIRTHEGWLYLTVVIDLFSRKVVGWTMKSSPKSDLVIDALLMAIWRRRPKSKVLIHSDQGVQYTSGDWKSFLKAHNMEISMSRKGNCHDNAVAESFFSLLKKDRVKKRIYKTRAEARSEIFDYIECFYNPRRNHGTNGGLSPNDDERQYFQELESV